MSGDLIFRMFLIGALLATLCYIFARMIKRFTVVDLIWTAGVGLVSVYLHRILSDWTWHGSMVLMVTLLWSSRLSIHILVNRVLSGVEDSRYQNLKRYWGASANRNFYLLFLAQIPAVFLFALPVFAALSHNPEAFGWVHMLAFFVAAVSMGGEWLADHQLADFKNLEGNRGKVCDRGLWKYSRHPNYFFEWLFWWFYVLMAWGSDYFIYSLAGPIGMYLFLTRISGIPHVERQAVQSRGEAYLNYQQTTNAFWPWIPRKLLHSKV